MPTTTLPARAPAESGDAPRGWSYNPSEWSQRWPIVALALLGFLASSYMAAYQLRLVAWVWDPFFPGQTERILDSAISRAFPVSDAALGALSYLTDAVSGVIGDRRRWRTLPWMVMLFGFFIIPPGIVSIVLVILQPIAVHAWCTLCLFTALAMLCMIPPAVDEVVACAQYLLYDRPPGRGFWLTFWKGGPGSPAETRPVRRAKRPERPAKRLLLSPWNLVASAGIGIWLMAAPAALGFSGRLADLHYVLGALVATFSVIAVAEAARAARWINLPLALAVAASPWLVAGGTQAAAANAVYSGTMILILAWFRGRIRERYGRWSRCIR